MDPYSKEESRYYDTTTTSISGSSKRSRLLLQQPIMLLSLFIYFIIPTTTVAAFVVVVNNHPANNNANTIWSSTQTTKNRYPNNNNNNNVHITQLYMSLKPAALPLMDSGKALARSGELIIDFTSSIDLYGGGLSAAGAQIRNSGDCLAQAGASMRFKTGAELVCDELREGATCLSEATDKLKLAIDEAKADKDIVLANHISDIVQNLARCSVTLEAAGAGIMLRQSVKDIGTKLETCGTNIQLVSMQLPILAEEKEDDNKKDDNDSPPGPATEFITTASQRMAFAAEKMIEAGTNLQGIEKQKPKGKSWLKG